jgi:hypothetical protein
MITTIDQHQGYHAATGMRVMQLVDVITTREGYEDSDPIIANLHAAEVALASLDADQRAVANHILADAAAAGCDVEDEAGLIRWAISQAEAAIVACWMQDADQPESEGYYEGQCDGRRITSKDGDTWTDDGGDPEMMERACPSFAAASIYLDGGPRDGEVVR